MKTIQEEIQNSTCYGIAHDPNVKECKICEIKQECKAKTNSEEVEQKEPPKAKEKPKTKSKTQTKSKPKPKQKEKAPESKPKTNTKAASKPDKDEEKDYPDFKAMSLQEMFDLAEERGVEVKKYDNEGIQRMRLTMALKKSY